MSLVEDSLPRPICFVASSSSLLSVRMEADDFLTLHLCFESQAVVAESVEYVVYFPSPVRKLHEDLLPTRATIRLVKDTDDATEGILGNVTALCYNLAQYPLDEIGAEVLVVVLSFVPVRLSVVQSGRPFAIG